MASANPITLDPKDFFQCDECEGYFPRKTSLVFESGRDVCKNCDALEAAGVLVDAVTSFLDAESPCPVVSDTEESMSSDEHDPEECNFCTLRKDVEEYERATGSATL